MLNKQKKECSTSGHSLAPAMCNRISCAQVHELPQSHCDDNREVILFSRLHIYYTHLAFVKYYHSVCRALLIMSCIALLTPCFTCWALFGSRVPVMCKRTSSAQVYELPQSHCGDNWESTLFFIFAYILRPSCFFKILRF